MTSYPVWHVHIHSLDAKPSWSFLDRGEAVRHQDQMREHVRRTMTSEQGRKTEYLLSETQYSSDFILPSDVKPRDLYDQLRHQHSVRQGCWDVQDVRICREGVPVAEYHRDYPGEPPFEVFRQYHEGQERHYALVSRHYEGTDVIDLSSGEVIASEDRETPGYGFCPAGFYVPDWRDVHDGSVFPGHCHWEEENDRWPDGTLGFVWGCHWGDDRGWKVQALDLSRVQEGVITRDDRFGYQYIEASAELKPWQFIDVHQGEGERGPGVTFLVPKRFTITGKEAPSMSEMLPSQLRRVLLAEGFSLDETGRILTALRVPGVTAIEAGSFPGWRITPAGEDRYELEKMP